MDAKPGERRKIETVVEQGKKTMVKEMTQSLADACRSFGENIQMFA